MGTAVDVDVPGWHDLSQNKAGQSARQKAIELRKEAPVKTVLARLRGSPVRSVIGA